MKQILAKVALCALILAVIPLDPVQAIATNDGNKIEFTTPKGGEVYDQGDTIKFKWTSTVSDYIYTYSYLTMYKLKGTNWDPNVSTDPFAANNLDLYADTNNPIHASNSQTGFADVGKYDWKIPSSVVDGQYVAVLAISYWNTPGSTDSGIQIDITNQPFTIGEVDEPEPGEAHAIGTNVLSPDGVVYRIVSGPNRSAYTSADIFLSYKFNKWTNVVTANSADLALSVTTPMPPRDGTLWNDKGTVYIVSEGKARQPFGAEAVFRGYGYDFKFVYSAETGYLEKYPTMTSSNLIHPDGTLIKNNGAYFIMNSRARLGVPSMAILESWGYWLEDAVPANSYDMATAMTTVLGMRPFEQYRY